jgi:hypothetical protein
VKFAQGVYALLFSGLLFGKALAAPSATEIIDRVKARAADAVTEKNKFAYQRISRVDYLDEKGDVKKNSVRVYEVAPVNGQPVVKVVQINGRAVEPSEPKHSAARETGEKTRNLALGDELLSRYQYKLVGEDTVAGRKAWVLEFKLKPGVPEDGFMDKLLNNMQGRMWVDQQEYELSKIDVHLGKKIGFFGGLAGAIEKLDLQMFQKRIDSQSWLTEALTIDFTGRKLFTPIRFRCFENQTDFHKVSPLATK